MQALRRTQMSTIALCALAIMLQACTARYAGNPVADAYESPDIIKPIPYTRTIFSSTNF